MKKYEQYKVEDFLQDESFVQWCYSGSPELTEFWRRWCEQYPEKVSTLQRSREIIQSIEYKGQKKAPEEAYQRILQRVMQESEKDLKTYKAYEWQAYWKVAAVLVMLVSSAVFYLGWQNVQQGESSSTATIYMEKYCPVGKKMSIVLKDGTKVRLNADTHLRYVENFDDSIRKVELMGEAFFEVAKDSARPFVIRSQHLQTTVLGTSFNVQAYPDSKVVDVAVVEGLVQVASERDNGTDNSEFFLTRGEKVSYNAHDNVWEKDSVEASTIGRWRNWELIFEQADIIDIARMLERWYGVKVIVEGPFPRKISFSGTYNNNTLYEVLEGIAYSAKFNYSLQGDTVYIKP